MVRSAPVKSGQGFARGRAVGLAVGFLGLVLSASTGSVALAEGPGLTSPWVQEQSVRTRLTAGGVDDGSGTRRLYAGLEIALEDGWKTYWRNPGSSGVPPHVDFAGSENVAAAELEFPAPTRFRDRDGDTIGYKHGVVLPVRVTPKDATKPVTLKLTAEFGICREVCVPVQPKMALQLPADAVKVPASASLASALALVPHADARGSGDPKVAAIKLELAAPKPRIVIDASFPGDPAKADIFLEAPKGIWIPLPKPVDGGPQGQRRFVVDLTDGADLADLKGLSIRMTLVAAKGQSETHFKFE